MVKASRLEFFENSSRQISMRVAIFMVHADLAWW